MAGERIRLDNATGREESAWLLSCAWSFATTYLDRPTGPRHGCVYGLGERRRAFAYWTKGRTVVVRLLPEVSP